MPSFYLPAMIALSLVMAVVLVGILVAITQVSGFFVVVFIALLAIFTWFMYRELFRKAYQLDLDSSQLRWRAPLRKGELQVVDLITLRPSRLTGGIWVFEARKGPNVPVFVRKGFRQFVQEVQILRPDLEIEPNDFTIRWSEFFPGRRSGFHNDGD